MSNKVIGKYKNGNYKVILMSDGTKIRMCKEDEFRPAFAETCDMKITNKCSGASCEFCYEGCNEHGKHGDILNPKFLETLHPYTELAINGNDLTHPELPAFLHYMRNKNVIVNMTVNQIHFNQNFAELSTMMRDGLIHGLGISLRKPNQVFISAVKYLGENTVLHVINGIFSKEDYEVLKDKGMKILILGYKQLKRGIGYFNNHSEEVAENQKWLYDNLEEVCKHFDVVSFDNLALDQLNVKRIVSEEQWHEFFMGNDGSASFYIDMVEQKFAKNSVAPENERYDIGDKSIDEMFNMIRER